MFNYILINAVIIDIALLTSFNFKIAHNKCPTFNI